jgi:hypothetical protein
MTETLKLNSFNELTCNETFEICGGANIPIQIQEGKGLPTFLDKIVSYLWEKNPIIIGIKLAIDLGTTKCY